MSKSYAKQTIVNHISYIEFYHPSHNSLPGEILQNLVELIKNAGENEDVRVIVLQSVEIEPSAQVLVLQN